MRLNIGEIPHSLLQGLTPIEYIQEKNSERYQLIFAVSIIAMLRKKHLISLGLMKTKKEKT